MAPDTARSRCGRETTKAGRRAGAAATDHGVGGQYREPQGFNAGRRGKRLIQPGTIVQGRYRVEHLLGEGGQGAVYLVSHMRLGTRHAMKVVTQSGDPSDPSWQQLEREARILAGLSHPNLARVTDLVVDSAFLGVCMEYVDGEPLAGWGGTCAPEESVLSVAAQVLDALEYLHGQNPPVIHRDLNPRNIIVAPDGRVRVVDFGIAKIPRTADKTETIVRGYVTPGFAPPEQYGWGGTDAASDIYALGATMLSLLGRSAIPDALDRVQGAHLHDPRQYNPTVSANTWSVIQQMMSIRQSTRPQSAAAVRALLFGSAQSAVGTPAFAAAVPHSSSGAAASPSSSGAAAPPGYAPHHYAPTALAPSPPSQAGSYSPPAKPAAPPSDDSPFLDFCIGAGGWRNTLMAMAALFYVNGPIDQSPTAFVTGLTLYAGMLLNAFISAVFRSTRSKSNSPSSTVCIVVYVLLWFAIFVALGVGLTWAEGLRRRNGLR